MCLGLQWFLSILIIILSLLLQTPLQEDTKYVQSTILTHMKEPSVYLWSLKNYIEQMML